MDTPSFADLLRRYRRQRNLTQSQLAERAGISSDAISLLERGLTQAPQKATVRLLSAALLLAPEEAATFAEAARGAPQLPVVMPGAPDQGVSGIAPDGNLPVPLTPLIGRERDIAALTELMAEQHTRLLTLTGPAGVGKTRLALELAATLRRERGLDVVFVGLIPVQEPERVLPAIAQALGVQQQGSLALRDTLTRALREQRLVLLLDNFEQALPAARAVLDLLIACPRVQALVTSRAPLNVRGERRFPVSPLALPDPSQLTTIEQLRQTPSVALFLERAESGSPDLRGLTLAECRLVADICAQLDGLPLAIELAAARVRHFGLPQLRARLTEPTFLGVLTDGAQDLADHQRAMRSTIAWSYDLLGADARRLFRWLGVFVGGASAEAIEAVTGLTGDALVASLAALMDASLLQCEDQVDTRRYSQLVTLRAYAQERLRGAGEWEEARRRHADYCLTLTDALLPQMPNESERQLARVEADYENVRAALGWALETGATAHGLRMVAALRVFWFLHSHYLEGLDWLERFLARSTAPTLHEERATLAEAWTGVMALSYRLNRFERARDAGEVALALRQAVGDKAEIAWALNNLANPVMALRDFDRAGALWGECIALQREMNHPAGMVMPLLNLGELHTEMGKPREALAYYEESLALSYAVGESDWARALTWNNMGEAYILLDEPARAIEVTEPSYHLFTEKHDTFGAAVCAFTLGRAHWRLGAAEVARAHLDEAERLFDLLGNVVMVAHVRYVRASVLLERDDLVAARRDLAQAFAGLAHQERVDALMWRIIERVATLASRSGEDELALRLYAAAAERVDMPAGRCEPAERDLRARDLDRLRASRDASDLAEGCAAAHALSLAEAAALASQALARYSGERDEPLRLY